MSNCVIQLTAISKFYRVLESVEHRQDTLLKCHFTDYLTRYARVPTRCDLTVNSFKNNHYPKDQFIGPHGTIPRASSSLWDSRLWDNLLRYWLR